MSIKKLDKTLDVCLWILFGVLLVVAFLWCRSIKAPEFEVVESTIKVPYVYSSEDGEKYDSFYVAAWKHERFSSPQVAVYDPRNGSNATIKAQYVEEYRSKMPDSKYPFYTRWTIAIFAVLAVIAALFAYWVGGLFRDFILYNRLKSQPVFTDCAYFLYEDRVAFRRKVKSLISYNIGKYIDNKSGELTKKYRTDFAQLLIHILKNVQANNDTDVRYYLQYKNKTTDQITHLRELREYWEGKIGKHEHAESNVQYINNLFKRDYLPITLAVSESDIVNAVNSQLNKLFTNILGGEVLRFFGAEATYAKMRKLPNTLFIDIIASNHHTSFSVSGVSKYEGKSFPGINVEFRIYHFVNDTMKVLWDKNLVPTCTYSASEDMFSSSGLYESMIIETIKTFEDKLGK